jgi:N utilization substance protein B
MKRTKARELALQFLYQIDTRGNEVLSQLDTFICQNIEEDLPSIASLTLPPHIQNYARELILGCISHWQELNDKIQKLAKNWELPRMAVIDRTILRIALYELSYVQDTPPKVAIDEAIELGKKYSTANSGAFINGILDKSLKDGERDKNEQKG